MSRVRVLLAEDSPVVARQLGALLEAEFDLVDIVNDGAAIFAAVAAFHPDVLVTDISLPGMLLEAQPGMDVVGQAESGEDALPMLRRLRPDVLLCDVHLPGISGLEVTERVVRGGYGTRVIVVSASQEAPLPRRAMEAGASAYVGKAHDASELVRAVQDAARGRRYLASGIAQSMPRERLCCFPIFRGRRPRGRGSPGVARVVFSADV